MSRPPMSGADPLPHPRPEQGAGGAGWAHRALGQRPGRPDEVPVAALGLDPFARLTLALMRLHFQTFSDPESQSWLQALRLATAHVGAPRAGALCYDVVGLVQALRTARTSPFRFNPDGCACCRDWLTPEERHICELLEALRFGRMGRARTLVQLLCDGSPDEDLVAVAEMYLHHNAPRARAAAR